MCAAGERAGSAGTEIARVIVSRTPLVHGVVTSTRGSGVVLALGVIAMVVIAGTAAGVAVDVVRCGQKVQHAANLSALAASDVATGVVAGRPCVVAREIARAQGIRLSSCEVAGSTARVYATTTRHGFSIVKRAAAGPLPEEVWQVDGAHSPWGENRP